MRMFSLRSRFVAVCVFAGLPAALAAQQLPSPGQAQQMLQNPATVNKVCQRVATSGMTPDQIRARLRAAGYPDTMLDACLNGGGNDTTFHPTGDVYAAVQQLGVVDSTDLALIRCGIDPDSLPADGSPASDSAGGHPGRSMRRMLADRCGGPHSDTLLNAQAKARADSGYNIFGMDFFRHQSTLFQPNLNGPVDSTYRLGPGDELVLILTGDVENSYTLDVTREGFIVIPQVGQISVNNLTLSQLTDVLYTRLGRVYSGIRRSPDATTRFSITPARLRSNLIYVTGDVLSPGAYQISSAGTLLTALYSAGGPNDNGSLRKIELRRGGRLVGTLDFYDYLVHGNSAGDVRLQNGDVVFVPVHLPRTRILGQIVRAGTYELKPKETLADVIGFAGGFTDAASRQRVQIERVLPPTQRSVNHDRVLVDVASDAFATGDGPPFPLEPGDVIHVFPITDRVRNQIVVFGNVNTPGPEEFRPNMTVADALRLAGGVKSDTYLGRVLISRRQPDSTRMQLHVTLRDTTGAVLNDIPLEEDDEIHVFATTEFSTPRYVAIAGAVHRGGQYPYHEGMTVRDLILRAGGVDQSAFLDTAKIARLPQDRSGARTAVEFNIPLDSSYLFERGPDGKYLGPPGLPASAGPTPDVLLKPYDNILILRQPNWELQQSVVVGGEVRFPGRYTLLNRNERITDVIRRAGGLTPEAYADGVTFFRTQNNVGRIGIDLPEVLRHSNDRDNLLLQDGDSIHIPRFSALVMVQGAVNAPVAVSYVPGADLNYYIRVAGGPSSKADEGRAYVVQSNGKVDTKSRRFLISDYVPKPGPGSKVFVPFKDPTDKPTDRTALVTAVAGIFASLVTVALALARF
ncbi:MAG TPA: SLBB domain-containing protein [Gemmatimonadaceae bacterium]|jgi:polysaccharide export outer membrane protein|nr:SLBB domain-containing protein [Gemmatimonadaceae bacterium]